MVKKNKHSSDTHKAERGSKIIMIPESEAREREVKYLARLADVSVSAELVKSAERDFYDQEIARAKIESWEHYLRCDGLPRPNRPVEVRTFIAKMRHSDEMESNCSLGWNLAVDERSILNQNIFRVDKTRPVVKLSRDSPDKYYDANVRMCLDTLKQMDVMLDNEADMGQMTSMQQHAIMDVYIEVQLEIEQLLNRLTYRVLKMQDSYMDTVDGITAYWSSKGNHWEMDLWGLRNVPLRFNFMELPFMFADMKATGVDIQIPTSVLTDCLTLRSVHTDFDYISQNAKSFEPAITESLNYPNAGIVDIQESFQNEWGMQEDIKFETLANMENKRQEYEDTMRLIAEKTEQAAKAAKQNNSEKPNIVIPKTPRIVPAVLPGMVPDVYNEFIRVENSEYAGYLDEVYHPRNLDIREYEINLRECIMLGGIYSILAIRRPDQTQFEKFNIVLHEDGRVLYTMPDLKTDVNSSRTSDIPRKSVDVSRGSVFNLEEEDVPYFNITLQLPADLCKWSQPQVCQFLIEEEPVQRDHAVDISIGSENSISNFNQSRSSRGYSFFSQSSKQWSMSIVESVDIANIFRPSIRTFLRNSKFQGLQVNDLPWKNFKLEKPLEVVETRNLESHCIPRIISSFKMPRDMLDEVEEVVVPKPNRRKLVKRQEVEETKPQQEVSRDLAYEDQHEPERLFPHFSSVPFIEYPIEYDTDEPEALFDQTALGLLKKLDHIKRQYENRPTQLWSQQESAKKKGPKPIARPAETAPVEEEPPEKPKTKSNKHTDTRSRLTIQSDQAVVRESADDDYSVRTIEVQGVTHWTKRYISDSSFDPETHKITFKTDRLGIFGLAFKRYEHFPFRDWSLQPNEENPDEIIFTLDTFHVRINFYITTQGVRAFVTDLSKAFTTKPVKYLEIEEPISDFGQLRQLFISKNINIFAENDASYYIDNGYFSMKHVAAEQHTYNIMGLYCKLMKFYRSSWNRLASRRDIIMNMKIAKDTSEYSEATLRITPEQTTFVTVSEKCSDDVNVILLSYAETWRNISNFSDLHYAIQSMVINATEVRNRDSVLLHYVTRMLKEVRPLSFS
ncbi:hypothetical protein KR054_011878 [Drosophila jambulina]|nr:hypothetical protein KR054_011878 [Drosophila jambulina]